MTTTLKRRDRATPKDNRIQQPVRELRNRYGMTRIRFARLVGVSERSLAKFESQDMVNESVRRQVTSLSRLHVALSRLVKADTIGDWFDKPNPAFGGLKPLEVVERGEEDRIWEMIYQLASGNAS